MSYYAVAHGYLRGIYTDWDEAKKQIDGFPQPVYKRFSDEGDAEKFMKERKARHVELTFPEPTHDKYYAVARGHSVGVFTDYEVVKKHIADYPQPLQKKFDNLDDAVNYFRKYYQGYQEDDESTAKGKKEKKEKEKKETSKPAATETFYAVARGHKTGVFSTWDECKKQTTDFKGAKFKKFDNEKDAKMFAEGKTLKQIEESHTSGAGSKRKADKEEEVEKKKKK